VTVERKRVVVIGAGIAGLVTAKVLRDDGFDVTAFEKEPAIGGVWAESRTYPGLRANNSRRSYAFSDHPYDRSADAFPTADQVRRYLASYVARFGLAPLIRLSTEVVGVSRRGAGFEVAVRGPDGPACLVCDFVVVCALTFSRTTSGCRSSGNPCGDGLFQKSANLVTNCSGSECVFTAPTMPADVLPLRRVAVPRTAKGRPRALYEAAVGDDAVAAVRAIDERLNT
jgi:hypothetical protein